METLSRPAQAPPTAGDSAPVGLGDRFTWLPPRLARLSVDRALVAVLVVVSLIVYAVAAWMRLRRGIPAGDEPAYLVLSQAMQLYHSLDVMRVYENQDYLSYYNGLLGSHVVPGADGQPETLHQFGGPLLWLIPFAIWGRGGALGFMVVVSVLCIVNIYYLLRERRIDAKYAFVVSLALAIGSPIYVLASMSFVEPIGALGVIFAVRALLLERLSAVRLVVASTGTAMLPWVHMRFAPIAVSLGLLLVWRVWRDHGKRTIWPYVQALAPLAISVALIEAFTITVYGQINPMAPQGIYGVSVFDVPLHEGFVGTLFDRNYGLIPNFPIFLLVLPGILLSLGRANLRTNAILAAVIVPSTVLSCTSTTWWGSYNPPARYPDVFVPLLGFYIAVVLHRVNRWYMTAATILLGVGAYVLHLGSDRFPGERFTEWDLAPRAMERVERHIGIDVVQYIPSSFLPDQRGLFALWITGTVVLGVVVWLVAAWPDLRRSPVAGQTSGPAEATDVRITGAPTGWRAQVLSPAGRWVAAAVAVLHVALVPLLRPADRDPVVTFDHMVGVWENGDGARIELDKNGGFIAAEIPDDVATSIRGDIPASRTDEPRRSATGQWQIVAGATQVELDFDTLDGSPQEFTGHLHATREAGANVMYFFVVYDDTSHRYAFFKAATSG